MKTLVETGRLGEEKALALLKRKGYKIVERNHREKWGELDIIARFSDKTLVFIEVKTMRKKSCPSLRPEDNMTKAKLKQVRKLAAYYANSHPRLIDKQRGWRIDLIALTIDDNCFDAAHYENVG
ncbi:MAG: YraN family protein [Candidatus Colwellbacteria bacterium]|nr:YraN family protein [Candidatus Colwellbacteria bacterium]